VPNGYREAKIIAMTSKAESNNQGAEVGGSAIIRNTLLNLIGQAVPLLIGVVTIPHIMRGLGTERFGLLSLAWVILGYFTVFDLGLGRATTKYVAEALGKGEEDDVACLVWTAATVQTILGLLGTFVLASVTSLLVERILNIPPGLVEEAKATFHILALGIPVVLVTSSFSGALEAAHRFDLINAVMIPSSTLTFLLPFAGILLGASLPGIVVLILLARLATLSAFVALNLHISPKLRRYSGSFVLFPRLFSFGGWVTVSNIARPILVYLDRFLIGSLLSMAAVSYYTAPYEAVTRLRIIPGSLARTLFPAFSVLEGTQDGEKLGMLFARSIKYGLLVLGPIALAIGLFAMEIMKLWLGGEFAMKSTVVLRILAPGVLVNSLAYTPLALLQAIGRPDLPAKFNLLEVPVFIGIAWPLISEWGIAGAAGAWTLRVALDAVLLYIAAFKVCGLQPRLMATADIGLTAIALLLIAGIACALKILTNDLPLLAQSIILSAFFAVSAWIIWRNLLDALDREVVLRVLQLRKGSGSSP